MADTHEAGPGMEIRRRPLTRPAVPPSPPVPESGLPADAPRQLHRGMTLVATISLFIGTRDAWTTAMDSHPAVAGVISVCYASILLCGVLSLLVRSRQALVRVDVLVLLTALTLVACGYVLDHAGADEGVLTAQAASEILRGHPVYGQPWPWLFDTPSVGVTKTMSGGADYTYGYPPLTALLAAPVHAVVHSTAAATLVTTGALAASSVLLWFLLPVPWRSAATAVCLGFGLLPHYAYSGYTAITALALLVPVVVRWPATGAGGRLGPGGVLRAACLGAACAAQQLAWFLLPFLLIGLYALRRGELGRRRGLAVTARYAATAALSWAAINAYFAVQQFSSWLHGTLLPLDQKAILHGQGVMGISYYFTAGSSRLDYYSYGSLLLLLALLAATLLFVRRLGPALTVLPWCAFYLATRSQDGYYMLMTPLWLAAVATVPAAAFATAWQPRLPRVTGHRAKGFLAAGLLAPAFVCVAIAAASPPPLRLSLAPHFTAHRSSAGVTAVRVHAVNTTGTTLTPHFADRVGQGASDWWTIAAGPAELAPHASADYLVEPPGGFLPMPADQRPRTYLIAVTGTPMTITTAPIPSPPQSVSPRD
ncbi:hypothetical protein [Streptomyces griseorubiginosus]|uniref:hypothetical protein n=1 Tax=Streptomyces griseorubiginosus TaxID=67304 RepID=UPI001AD7A2B3|nr:hypothetical protein [Streptomyces griseorubiginosus]MBO4252708.1 hypothetical protein [Streptomyces griseorubiginosus]